MRVQLDARDAIVGSFDQGETRATVVLPGGSGKTVLGLRVAEALSGRGDIQTCLVLLPGLDLVTQTYTEWNTWKESPRSGAWSFMAVCSSVASSHLGRTTDPPAIVDFLRGTRGSLRVLLCTYHSAHKVAEALRRVKAPLIFLFVTRRTG